MGWKNRLIMVLEGNVFAANGIIAPFCGPHGGEAYPIDTGRGIPPRLFCALQEEAALKMAARLPFLGMCIFSVHTPD